jgi:hypothetical protein
MIPCPNRIKAKRSEMPRIDHSLLGNHIGMAIDVFLFLFRHYYRQPFMKKA